MVMVKLCAPPTTFQPQTIVTQTPEGCSPQKLRADQLTPSAGELEHSTTPCLLLHAF